MTRNKIRKIIKDSWVGWLFNSPLFIGLLIFTVIPVFYSLYMSFWRTDGLYLWEWRGFKNYTRMFTDDKREMLIVCKNTVFYVLVSIPINLVTSYLLAALVNDTSLKGVKTFRILFYLPCMIPGVASALIWKELTRYTNTPEAMGELNKLLMLFGFEASHWFSEPNIKAILSIIFINMWGVGGGMILWLSAFKAIDKGMYEAADIEGAGKFRKLIHITIPMSTAMIFYNLIMSVIGSMVYTFWL